MSTRSAPAQGTSSSPGYRAADPHLRRAHRRGRLRLRRGRAEVRPELRRGLRQDGQRRLDGGDHPRRDPAAAALARQRQRASASASAPSRSRTGATRRTSSSPSTSRSCSPGTASARWPRTRSSSSRTCGPRTTTTGIVAAWKAAMEEMSGRSYRFVGVPMEKQTLEVVDNPRRGKNMFALGLLSWIYDRDLETGEGADRTAFRKKSKEVYEQNVAAPRPRRGLGRGEPRLPHRRADPSRHAGHGRDERQQGDRHGRHRGGHGPLRHVPDHAGHLGLALPGRGVRPLGRDPAPGRGRDRGRRRRDRRLLRGQGRVHGHLRAGPGAQDRVHRPGGHDRDPARRRRRAARRSEHGPARRRSSSPTCSPRCSGSRATRRRSSSRRPRSRSASTAWSPPGGSPRRSAAWSSSSPTPTSPPASSPGRGRSSTPAGRPGRRTSRRCPRARGPTSGTRSSGSADASSPASRAACTRRRASATTSGSKVTYAPDVNQRGCAMRSRKLAVLQDTLQPPTVVGEPHRRPAGRRLGEHQGRDRGGGAARPRRGTRRLLAAPHVPLAARAGHQGDLQPLQEGDDRRDQLQRRARRAVHHRREPAPRPARVPAPRPARSSTSTAGTRSPASRCGRHRSCDAITIALDTASVGEGRCAVSRCLQHADVLRRRGRPHLRLRRLRGRPGALVSRVRRPRHPQRRPAPARERSSSPRSARSSCRASAAPAASRTT